MWADHGGGHYGREHDGKQRSALIQFIDQDEHLSALIDDPRIHDVCASVLGDDFNYSGSDGNFYVGDTLWHSDGYRESKYLSFKMAFYLDPVTANRAVSGSFRGAISTATCSATASKRCANCVKSPTTPARHCGA